MSEYKITDEQIGEIAVAVFEAVAEGQESHSGYNLKDVVIREIRKALAPEPPKFRTVWMAWTPADGAATLHLNEPRLDAGAWCSRHKLYLGGLLNDPARAGQCVRMDLPDTEATR